MPAATVGSAYAEQKHLDKTDKPYRDVADKRYSTNELIEALGGFSGLEDKVLQKQSLKK